MFHILAVLFGTQRLVSHRWVFLWMGLILFLLPLAIWLFVAYRGGDSLFGPRLGLFVLLFSAAICVALARSLLAQISKYRLVFWPVVPQVLFLFTLILLVIEILDGMTAVLTAPWGIFFGLALLFSGVLAFSGIFLGQRYDRFLLFAGIYNIAAGLVLLLPWPLLNTLDVDFIASIVLLRIALAFVVAFSYFGSRRCFNESDSLMKSGSICRDDSLINSKDVTLLFWLPYANLTRALKIPLIARYWMSLSRPSGMISVGHVVFQAGDSLYASIYPKINPIEGSHSRGLMSRLRRACNAQSDPIPGFWAMPSRDYECFGEPTYRLDFPLVNQDALLKRWSRYDNPPDYHLVRRNCALTSIELLESSLSGCFSDRPFFSTLIRLLFNVSFWEMVHAHDRAWSTLWSPGMALDYATAASSLVRRF